MPKYLPLPDGSYLQLKEGESGAEGLERARSTYPEAFASTKSAAQPEGGFIAATKAGATELGGGISALMGKLGLKDTAQAQREYEEAQKRAKEIFKPTEAGWTEDPWTKFKETLGGSVPYMAAPLAAGAAAAALPLTGTAATIAGLGAAGLTSAGQFTATNLARQMDKEQGPGRSLAETDLGAAALAALPQAALDTLSMRMIPGIGKMFGAVGEKVTAQTAKQIAEQGLKKVAADYAMSTGKAMGTEGLTEAAQQVFERLQAGLNITDEQARQEYFDNFIGGAVLGGALAPAGRYVERGGEKAQAQKLLAEEQKAQRAKDAAAEEEKRQQPDYLERLNGTYQNLQQQKQSLQAQLKKSTKDTPLTQDDKDNNELINRQLKELSKPLEQARREFLDAGGMPALQKMRVQQQQDAERRRVEALALEDYAMEQLGIAERPGAAGAAPAAPREAVTAFLGEYDTAPQLAPEEEYAQQQMARAHAQDLGAYTEKDFAQYLMQDPERARGLVTNNTPIPGVSARESTAILAALKLQLREFDKQQRQKEKETAKQQLKETQAELQQRQADLLAQRGGKEAADPTALWLDSLTQAEEQAAQQQRDREEEEAQRRAEEEERERAALLSAQQTSLFPEKRERKAVTVGNVQDTEEWKALERQRRALQQQLDRAQEEAGPLQPAPYATEPWSDVNNVAARKRAEDLKLAIDGVVQQQNKLTERPRETRSTAWYADQAQLDIGPKPTTTEQFNSTLDRLQSMPQVSEEDKALAQALQDNLQPVLRQLSAAMRDARQRQTDAAVKAGVQPVAAPATSPGALVSDWLSRALRGADTTDVAAPLRDAIRSLQQGAISETEQRTQYAQRALTEDEKASLAGTSMEGREGVMTRAPSGEIAQQMQYTLPMPEPTAEARESWAAFNEYLASDGLDILRKAAGLLQPTVARLNATLAPLEAKLKELQAQLQAAAQTRKALQRTDARYAEQIATVNARINELGAELDDVASRVGATEEGTLSQLVNAAQMRLRAARSTSERIRDQLSSAAHRLKNERAKLAEENVAKAKAIAVAKEKLSAAVDAFAEADAKAEAIAQEGNKKSWGPRSKTLQAYTEAIRIKEAAREKMIALQEALTRISQEAPAAAATLRKVLAEKAKLDTAILKASLEASNARTQLAAITARLDAVREAVRSNPALNFGNTIDALHAQVRAAETVAAENTQQLQALYRSTTEASREAAAIRSTIEQAHTQARTQARERAEARGPARPTTTETLSEREARDAAQRREEQARLERAEQGRTRVEFRRQTLAEDPNIANLQDEAENAATPELREAARKKLTEILNQRAAKLDEEAKAMAQRAAKNVKDLNAARTKLAELEDTLKKHESGEKKLTPKRLESAKKQRDEAARKFEEHQRRYQLNTNEVRIVRTDIQQERADRKQLLEEVNRTRVAGERLGVSEGTQKRGISPTMRDEVFPPRAIRTGSEESRAGKTTTTNKNPLTEVRGVKQRDVAMTEEEQIEANELAKKMQAEKKAADEQLLAQKKAADEKRALEATKEAAQIKPQKVKKTPSRVQQAFADLADVDESEFTPELLGGPEEEVYFSRGAVANPSTSASVKEELKSTFGDLSRVKVFDTVDDLLAAHPEYEGKIPADSRGFVDTAGNKAFLIGENIEQGQALGVLLHEVGAHIGLKNMLGEAQYNALVKAVEKWAAQNNGSTESRVARAAQQRVEAAETTDAHKDDELLAYAIEEAVAAGVTPTAMKGPIGQWLGRIVQALRKALEKFGLKPKDVSLQDIVNMAYGAAQKEMTTAPALATEKAAIAAAPEVGDLFFSKKSSWNPGMQAAGAVVDKAVASEQSWASKLKASLYGFRTMAVDKLAPVEQALQQKVAEGTLADYKATQAMYYLRMYDQRNHFTSKAVSDGVPHLVQITRDDGRKEHIIEAKPGANIKGIVDILKSKDVAKAAGSADAAHRLFSMYLIAERARRVGLEKLDFGGSITEADLKTVRQAVESDPTLKNAFKEARDIYNQYNRNLLDFAVQTGAMSRELANNLLRDDDYTPYYRVKDGVVNMLVGGQHPIKIGNLKDSPHLQELIGGDKPVIDFLTASVQNTSMLLDMAMKNIAQKNLVWEMHDLGLAKMRTAKHGAAPQNAIKFYDKGVESYALLDEAALADMGLDAGLMLKGLQGIPTMLPAALRLMAIPARILRRAVVASPVYAARQLFRDSLGAAMTSGANLTPVVSALRQFGKTTHTLDKRGVTGGQVFSGMPDDISRLLKQMQAGKGGWTMALAKLEAMSMEADAATRRAQYESYRKQGLSEMEATYMALESMNFSKRGLSPSLHAISQIIPFFNAQIQSLDVLQRAMRGKMPMQEQLDIKRKLYTRGLLLAAGTLAYAMAMQDDDAYKNATPEQKYGNWFVRVPGLDEPVRVPIPFELGYIFKALPEAMVNTMLNEKGGEEALKALAHIVQQTIPGGSSYGIPQAVKPLIEVGLGKSFFTGRDIESAKEQMEEPFMRYRDKTTDAAKWVGEVFNISPVKIEYLINGYTGGMGLAMMAALNPVFPDVTAPGALKRLSEYPVVGGAIQPNDAAGIIDGAYERVLEIQRVQQTYKTLLQQNPQRAQAYLEEKGSELAMASAAGQFRQTMGELTKQERVIRSAPSMTPQAKRESLDRIRQVKIRLAASMRPALDRTTPPAARP